MNTQAIKVILCSIGIALLTDSALAGSEIRARVHRTTQLAREAVLQRIEEIGRHGDCRRNFARRAIDLSVLRATARKARFYDATGPAGNLKFSDVVGKPSSPDLTLQTLARQITADAFVLGYIEDSRYVRTNNVVLWRGYFELQGVAEGPLRSTTADEKQSLLLHEILHIALDKDDVDLNCRELCPFRLLSFCSQSRSDF